MTWVVRELENSSRSLLFSQLFLFWFVFRSVIRRQENAFGIDRNDIIRISAKTGVGVADIFPAIVRRIKPPPSNLAAVRF